MVVHTAVGCMTKYKSAPQLFFFMIHEHGCGPTSIHANQWICEIQELVIQGVTPQEHNLMIATKSPPPPHQTQPHALHLGMLSKTM